MNESNHTIEYPGLDNKPKGIRGSNEEEWARSMLVLDLIDKGYRPNDIRLEELVTSSAGTKRIDLVLYVQRPASLLTPPNPATV